MEQRKHKAGLARVNLTDSAYTRLQFIVFALVSASYTTVYITQPVLPMLQEEFAADMVLISFSVSAVLLGIAISNLPFGFLADRLPIHPIILIGGGAVTLAGFVGSLTKTLWILILARFVQGFFFPALTTCLAAYLAKTLPKEKLSIVMGSYVSATVVGGLGSRLLGGWMPPPWGWRYALILAALLTLMTTIIALLGIPRGPRQIRQHQPSVSFWSLLKRGDILLIYFCAAGGLAIFSPIFNYLSFRLTASPFNLSTELTTLVYLVYIAGIFVGPTSGRISNRYGSGNTLLGGATVLGASLILLLLPSISTIVIGLFGICTGFFTLHAAAVGTLNRKLSGGFGRANALYVLFYYVGGWLGITSAGFAYELGGWHAVIYTAFVFLSLPVWTGISERKFRE